MVIHPSANQGLPDSQRCQLFLKDSKVVNYLSAIEESEIIPLELGDNPAIEALGFAESLSSVHSGQKQHSY